MKTFANFLYMGNLLAQCPEGNAVITGAYNRVFKPRVKIIEEDCGTKVGEVREATTKSVGLLEVYNDQTGTSNVPLIPSRLKYINATLKKTKVNVRTLRSCTSVGGVCRKCFHASYQWIDPLFDRLSLTTVGEYPKMGLVPEVGQSYVFDFTGVNSGLILSYLSKGYSGSLLGMKSYLVQDIPIRPDLLRSYVPENISSFLIREVADTGLVPHTTIQYVTKMEDTLEQVLYLLSQYFVGYYTSQ